MGPQPMMMVWVPASMLPPDHGIVACWSAESQEFFCGWYSRSFECWLDSCGDPAEVTVTHWAVPRGPART